MSQRPRIGFLTITNPRSRGSWSGTYYFMADALQRRCGDVVFLGPLQTRLERVGRLLGALSQRLLGKRYDYRRSGWYTLRVAGLVRKEVEKQRLDYIVVPAAAAVMAGLDRTDIPVVGVSDTTFALINDYYDNFSDYLSVSIRDGHRMAKSALERADIVTFPTQWAADSAIRDYGIAPGKVHVIPFGANIEPIPPSGLALQRRRSGECRLLFLGVDWKRKGGDIALETLLSLEREHGIQAHLTVCGVGIPEGIEHPRITAVGFLAKDKPEEAKALSRLFEETDYLLLPTRRECYGVVFCEASSYGVPSISTDTGGVSGVISDGKNGFLLPEAARGPDYARVIAGMEADDAAYEQLCRNARDEYDSRLNWDAWAGKIQELVDGLGVRPG